MSRRVRFPLLFLVATTSLVGLNGCAKGPDDIGPPPPPTSSTGGKSGGSSTGGKSGSGSGGDSSSSSGSGGAPSSGSGGGSAPSGTGGSGGGSAPSGTGGTTPSTDGGGTPETGGGTDTSTPPASGDWMGYPGVSDLTQVVPTAGCGKAPTDLTPGQWKVFTISGIPTPAGQRDNPGSGTRKYFARLPANYKPDQKYKVLIAASSCTGGNQSLAAMSGVDTVTDGTGGAILISPVVEPGVWDPDQCYDDKDPNSIEHPFLERFLAQVGEKACYDKNKVFVQGHSSGGWYSNMIGWVHTTKLVRAMSSNGGGLPDDSTQRPVLTDKPLAGLWIHPQSDPEQPMAARRSVSRALVMNKCQGAGTDPDDIMVYTKAPSVAWAEGGAVGCKKYMCPAAFPVIFCTPPGSHQNLSWHAGAAWAMFNALP
jgi:hypothetical protein